MSSLQQFGSRWFNVIAVSALALLLAGCAANGPIYNNEISAKPDKALLLVYRPSAMYNSGGYPNLFVNGRDHGPLLNGGYLSVEASPGTVEVVLKGEFATWGTQKPIGVRANVQAGKRYFFRFGNEITSFFAVPAAGFYTSRIAIQETPEEFALKEISETRLSIK